MVCVSASSNLLLLLVMSAKGLIVEYLNRTCSAILRIRVRIRIKEMPETLCRKGFQVNDSPKGYHLNNRG